MGAVGEAMWFRDVRGDRHLRVSMHDAEGIVIVSLWSDGVCSGTVQLPMSEAADLAQLISEHTAEALSA